MKNGIQKLLIGSTVCFAIIVCGSMPSFAVEKGKFAVVDIGKLFDEYEKTKKFDQEFQSQGKAKQEERDAIVHEIRKLRDEQALLSEEARHQKQGAIDAKMKDLDGFDEQTRKALADKRNEAVKSVFQDIENTMKQYGERKGYDFIFNDRALLYSNKGFDITADILKELNQKYQKEHK